MNCFRPTVTALALIVVSSEDHDGLINLPKKRNLFALPSLLESGKNLRVSLLEPLVLLPVGRKLHSKSAKSKSTKSKSSKSKSSKNRSKSESSNSKDISNKGSKSFTITGKSGKSKSAKGGESKSEKGATRSKNSILNSSKDNIIKSSAENETIIPAKNHSAHKNNTSSTLDDNMDPPDNSDESASSNFIPNSEYTTVKIESGSDGASALSSSSRNNTTTTEERLDNGEPSNLSNEISLDLRIAGGESVFIDSEIIGEKNDGANEELVENEAILDISSETLE